MNNIIELETPRLKLRQYKNSDLPVFAKINADPLVMQYYPNTLNQSESDELVNYFKSLISEQSWGVMGS